MQKICVGDVLIVCCGVSGCLDIISFDQPTTVRSNSVMQIKMRVCEDWGGSGYPFGAIMLPNSWTV